MSYNTVSVVKQPRPATGAPFPYSHNATQVTAYGALQGAMGDASGGGVDPQRFPAALCVTSRPGSELREKCMLAFESQRNPSSDCGWSQRYLLSVDSDQVSGGGGYPSTCAGEGNQQACCPPGTTALFCGGDNSGLDFSDQGQTLGSINTVPAYICVPTSEAKHDVLDPPSESCYAPTRTALGRPPQPHDYRKTSLMTRDHSNPWDKR